MLLLFPTTKLKFKIQLYSSQVYENIEYCKITNALAEQPNLTNPFSFDMWCQALKTVSKFQYYSNYETNF